jgi:hypothetical protein
MSENGGSKKWLMLQQYHLATKNSGFVLQGDIRAGTTSNGQETGTR